MDLTEAAKRAKALADPTRLRILELLPEKAVCSLVYNVSDLVEELGIPQPTVSHHLKVLSEAGLIQQKKMCRDVFYWVDTQAVRELLEKVDALTKENNGAA
jgi:ArsR family transcriptional regulator